MYLTLLMFVVLPLGVFGANSSWAPDWLMTIPLVALNLVSFWAGAFRNRHYWTALFLVYVDAGMMAALTVLATIPLAFNSRWYLAILPAVAAGTILALHLELSGKFSAALLPVRKLWARRLFAGMAVALLLPLSPGVTFVFLTCYAKVIPGIITSPVWGFLWLVTSMLYMAPLYRRIADGVPPNVLVPKTATEVPVLEDILAKHRETYSGRRDAMARLILRNEKPVYDYFLSANGNPSVAVQRTRVFFQLLWGAPTQKPLDNLEFPDLAEQLSVEIPEVATLSIHMTDEGLLSLPRDIRILTGEWLANQGGFVQLAERHDLPHDVAFRRICFGVCGVLNYISRTFRSKAR